MNIDDITKRIDDSFGVDIKDIYGRRIYPGDLVYYSGIDSRCVQLGIVSKLTKTGCKILNSNKLFNSNELCIVNGNENASLAFKEKHKKELAEFNKAKEIEKATKRKSIIFIEKTMDGRIFLGQCIFDFLNAKEMKEKMEAFANSRNKLLFLCKDQDGNPYFSNDIKNKELYFQPLLHLMFYQRNAIHEIEYISSNIKKGWEDEIISVKENIEKKTTNGYYEYSALNKGIEFISKKEDLTLNCRYVQKFFDDDFLFLVKDYKNNIGVDTSSNVYASFAYYWLDTLAKSFYKLENYYYDSYNCQPIHGLENFLSNEVGEKIHDMYMFLKNALQSI